MDVSRRLADGLVRSREHARWRVPRSLWHTRTFTPQDGSGAQQIAGIIQHPAMAEDYVPGGVQGTSWFGCSFVSRTSHRRRDTATLSDANSTIYDVVDLDVDAQGGAVLKRRVT